MLYIVLICFCLNSSKEFYIDLGLCSILCFLKNSASVPYCEVFVLGNVSRMLFRRLKGGTFKSKDSCIIGGLMWFRDLQISISNVSVLFSWVVQELSLVNKSSKFASSISYTTHRLRLWILLMKLCSFTTKHPDQRAVPKSWYNVSLR